jgi:hypothetical protein
MLHRVSESKIFLSTRIEWLDCILQIDLDFVFKSETQDKQGTSNGQQALVIALGISLIGVIHRASRDKMGDGYG